MRRTATTIVTAAFVSVALAVPSGARASSADRNHDGLPDKWETKHHLSLKASEATLDQDRDGLNNLGEFRRGTNPNKADSDRDGLKDGAEVRTANNPRKRDTDGDGIRDGAENAGSVLSFKDGVLTIRLADGSAISSTVSDGTHTSCDAQDENEIENETTVHRRRRGATASAARNGIGGNSSTSTPDPAQADDPGRHQNDETENEVENQHAAESETAHEDAQHGADDCSTTDMTPGAAVHEAKLDDTAVGATFSEVQIVK